MITTRGDCVGYLSCEIDKVIADVHARKALAVERGRRQRWQRVIENAAAFDRG
jgi:hypothetical protein